MRRGEHLPSHSQTHGSTVVACVFHVGVVLLNYYFILFHFKKIDSEQSNHRSRAEVYKGVAAEDGNAVEDANIIAIAPSASICAISQSSS